jgi:lipoprotein signal peptidase
VDVAGRTVRERISPDDQDMNQRNLRQLTAGVAAIVAVDLGTKLAAEPAARVWPTGPIEPTRNPEFSLGLAGAPWIVMVALGALAVLLATTLAVRAIATNGLPLWIPAALIGGALANVVDRAVFGSVHDFIATRAVVFNLADVAVFAGIAGLLHWRHRAFGMRKGVTP